MLACMPAHRPLMRVSTHACASWHTCGHVQGWGGVAAGDAQIAHHTHVEVPDVSAVCLAAGKGAQSPAELLNLAAVLARQSLPPNFKVSLDTTRM